MHPIKQKENSYKRERRDYEDAHCLRRLSHRRVPSLNDCLHTGPSLQKILWSVLVRGRFRPVSITGDLQKAFLQVRIREYDRDSTGDQENKLNFRRSDSHEIYSGWHLRRSSARRRTYRAPSGKLGRSQTRSRTRNTKDTPQMLKRKN